MADGGVHEEVGILHALGNALIGEQFADVVAGEESRQLFGGDISVNGHGDLLRSLVFA
jgi:hypothetical protein